jgi:hypothetical protein
MIVNYAVILMGDWIICSLMVAAYFEACHNYCVAGNTYITPILFKGYNSVKNHSTKKLVKYAKEVEVLINPVTFH